MALDPTVDELAIENPFDEGSAEARLYEVIGQLESPQPVAEFATRADCDPWTVQEILWSFVSLGLVIKHRGTEATYARNDTYFEKDTG